MNYIKGIELIIRQCPSFQLSQLTQVIGLYYHVDIEDEDNEADLILDFVLNVAEKNGLQRVTLKFETVSNLRIGSISQAIHLGSLEIQDMRECRWDENQRFVVRDYEDDILEFMCRAISVVYFGDVVNNGGDNGS